MGSGPKVTFVHMLLHGLYTRDREYFYMQFPGGKMERNHTHFSLKSLSYTIKNIEGWDLALQILNDICLKSPAKNAALISQIFAWFLWKIAPDKRILVLFSTDEQNFICRNSNSKFIIRSVEVSGPMKFLKLLLPFYQYQTRV